MLLILLTVCVSVSLIIGSPLPEEQTNSLIAKREDNSLEKSIVLYRLDLVNCKEVAPLPNVKLVNLNLY